METKYSKESLWLINQPFDDFPPQQDPSLYAQQKIEVLLIYRAVPRFFSDNSIYQSLVNKLHQTFNIIFPQKRVFSPGFIRIQVSV